MLFFISIPRSPRSTLFPYTTLFRSEPGRGRAGVQGPGHEVAGPGEGTTDGARGRTTPERRVHRDADPDLRVDAGRDRKSTRLNSSHANSSYAVFCLKKKTPRPRSPV